MWSCPKCRELVEDEFDVCWNCGTAKDGTQDPSFRQTDDADEEAVAAGPFHSANDADEEAVTAGPPNAHRSKHRLIVTTGNEVAGHTIVGYIGIVRGIVVRTPSITQGILGGLQQIVGGNIESYAEVCEDAREEAYQRMALHANEKGADAVISMRYDATEFAQGVTEVLAYGTAVKLSRN
jgi:uncharacterized protein YbjQ (UPF0145 family)